MSRKIISLLLILVLCMSLTVSAFAAEQHLFDEADLLTAAEEAKLSSKLSAVSQKHNAQIIVATVDSAGGKSATSFINSYYDDNGFGYGADRDGVLLVLCMDIREYRILSNGYAGTAISGSEIDNIGDAIVSDLSDGDYADAFSEFADQCDYYLNGYLNGFPFDFGRNLVIALIIGLIAGLITALVLKGQLKSVHSQDRAHVYIKSGSMQLTTRSDLYLYRNVTRTRKPTESSSSKSGSSRSVGGGKF